VADDDEFDQRNPFLLAMLGLLSLADDALAREGDAPAPEPWAVTSRRDEGPLLR
jgi:hypothetical protein